MKRRKVLHIGRPENAAPARYRGTVPAAPFAFSAAADERRHAWRYQLKLGLKYEISDKRASQIGHGETCDISNRSLRFAADTPLPAESRIELAIDWPARADEAPPLCLNVVGTVLRCNSRGVVVLIRRYGLDPAPAAAAAVWQ